MSKASKRERQRLNREVRREAELSASRRRKQMRAVRNGAILLLPLVAIFIVVQVTGSGSSTRSSSSAHTFATLETSKGNIVIQLDPSEAPKTVDNFVKLARKGFYANLKFHRASTSAGVIQTGDPKGNGSGGPGYTIPDEFPKKGRRFKVGDVAMANAGQPHSGGSQFFIITSKPGTQLPPQYSRFGHVVVGLDIAQQIEHLAPPNGDGPPTQEVALVTVLITKSKQLPIGTTPSSTPSSSAPPSS